MTAWFLRTIGVSDTITGHLSGVRWMWGRPYLLLVGLALLVPASILIVMRQRANLSQIAPRLRWLLSACRIAVLLLLVIVLGAPYVRLEEPLTQKPVLVWLTDASASMDLPVGAYGARRLGGVALAAGMVERPEDGSRPELSAELRRELAGTSRAELLQKVMDHNREGLMKPLAERFELRAYRFAREMHAQDLGLAAGEEAEDSGTSKAGAGEARSPGDGRGGGSAAGAARDEEELPDVGPTDTALGSVLDKVLAETPAGRLAGIVLFSDGRSTSGTDPVEVVRRHLGTAAPGAAAPVWVVPVGGTEPPVDISLLDVFAPAEVSVGDTGVAVVSVASHGFDNRSVKVRLLKGEQVVSETSCTLQSGRRQQVQLEFEAGEPGVHLLKVEVEQQDGELITTNNSIALTVEVGDERLRVLYLEGYPQWDFRFLDHALRRDRGIESTLVMEASLRAAGAGAAALPAAGRVPADAEGFAKYNVVMLGDITPEMLPPARQEALVKAVREEGVGVIVRAGPVAMPHRFAGQPLEAILPVRFQGPRRAGMEAPAFAPFRMAVTADGATHPVFRLYASGTRNRGVWSRMPSFFWAAAVSEPAPGASVLAEVAAAGETRPLIVEHFAGAGRVLFVGTDSTFRWRRNIGDHLFYRFWGQAIRRVARSEERGTDRDWIEAHPATTVAGDSVLLELYAVDAGGAPLSRSEVPVRISCAEWVQTVMLSAGVEPGRFRGRWSPEKVGDHLLSYATAAGESVKTGVRVAESGQEMLRPGVDRDALAALAEASGGGFLELDRIAEIPGHIKGETVDVQRVHEEELWDNWLMLVLLVTIYCTGVFVRRTSGLT